MCTKFTSRLFYEYVNVHFLDVVSYKKMMPTTKKIMAIMMMKMAICRG